MAVVAQRCMPYADSRYIAADAMNIREGKTNQSLRMLNENRKEKNSELKAFDNVERLLSTPYNIHDRFGYCMAMQTTIVKA